MGKTNRCLLVATSLFLLTSVLGCAGSSRYTSTTQPDDKTVGLSDTDVKMLAGKIVRDLLASEQLSGYEKPVTISLLPIANKTTELLDADALFGEQIMEALINSGGTLQFVDRSLIEESLKEAELAADGLVAQGEATRLGRMAGVRLLMTGELLSIRTADRRSDQRYYKLSLRLVDTERNTVVWMSSEDIRKTTRRGWMQ